MSTAQYLLANDLPTDSTDKIITYDTRSYDAVKQKISLYLSVNSGEVPFSSFGNTLLAQLYSVNNEAEASLILKQLMNDLNNFLQDSVVSIVDSSAGIDRTNRAVNLTLNLSNGQNVTFNI